MTASERRRGRSERIRRRMVELEPSERRRDAQVLDLRGDLKQKSRMVGLLQESVAITRREFEEETRMKERKQREERTQATATRPEAGAVRARIRTCVPPELPQSLQEGRDGVTGVRLDGDFVRYSFKGKRLRVHLSNVALLEDVE